MSEPEDLSGAQGQKENIFSKRVRAIKEVGARFLAMMSELTTKHRKDMEALNERLREEKLEELKKKIQSE